MNGAIDDEKKERKLLGLHLRCPKGRKARDEENSPSHNEETEHLRELLSGVLFWTGHRLSERGEDYSFFLFSYFVIIVIFVPGGSVCTADRSLERPCSKGINTELFSGPYL